MIEKLLEHGYLNPTDYHLVKTLDRYSSMDEHCQIVLGLLFRNHRLRHVCFDLQTLSHFQPYNQNQEPIPEFKLPDLKDLISSLRSCDLVSPENGNKPFILDRNKLFLRRYWLYQKRLIDQLKKISKQEKLPHKPFEQHLHKLFEKSPDPYQISAVKKSVTSNFTIISGGPGTGKTTTVLKILALLYTLHPQMEKCQILAPTGKAAARLSESISNQIDQLSCSPEVKAKIPRDASTIHRSLGYQPTNPTQFLHNKENPLDVECIVVDEASMIDLALLCKLLEAIPDESRIILIGDHNQLASVEAGAIMGDLYKANQSSDCHFLKDHCLELKNNYRFSKTSGIGRFAKAINQGDTQTIQRVLVHCDPSIQWHSYKHHTDYEKKLGLLVKQHIPEPKNIEQALHQLTQFIFLCAHKKGRFGSAYLNEHLTQSLKNHPYKPVIITKNDHNLGLFNGDLGVLWQTEDKAPSFFLKGKKNKIREIPLSKLPPHETCYAMTIHRSQGSEFESTALIFPNKMTPILTRELIYTGVTRAKKVVNLMCDPDLIPKIIETQVNRSSGILDMLIAK